VCGYPTLCCRTLKSEDVDREGRPMPPHSEIDRSTHPFGNIIIMTDQTLNRSTQCAVGWGTALVGFAFFGLLSIVSILRRQVYLPNKFDIPALADGLLLAPGAHWQDWFTRGYTHFWDVYPEWPQGVTGFMSPAFQFVIYLVHFALGRDWASYQVISSLAAAGMAAVAFLIARTALGLRTGPSLLAVSLVVLSPPFLQTWLFGLANAHDPLATIFVAGAFLAAIARRDFLCFMLLCLAVLTKENAVCAPVAAAITIMLRPKPEESLGRQGLIAAAMLLPIAMWLGLRFAFFGGIGGTYATAGYTPLADFLTLTFQKLTHIDTLLVAQDSLGTAGRLALLDRPIKIGTRLLIYTLLFLLPLRILPETVTRLRDAVYERRLPTVDATFLVVLWAAIPLAFFFAIPLQAERYATSVAVFAWPALVAEVERRRKAIIWLTLAVCGVMSLTRSLYATVEWIANPFLQERFGAINAALRQLPAATRQVYILSAGGLQGANPEYVRLVLGVSAEIVRVVDINWKCDQSSDLVVFDHSVTDGVVNLTATLPACADFGFFNSGIEENALVNGRLYRNDAISYELPEAHPIKPTPWTNLYLGRKMTVHVRPNGHARFIIEHGSPGGIAWFDTP